MQGEGLPKLALTPGTAGRLRRPSRLLTLRQGPPSNDKENESSSPSPSESPPRAMRMHQNPLSLETPPSSPGKQSSHVVFCQFIYVLVAERTECVI